MLSPKARKGLVPAALAVAACAALPAAASAASAGARQRPRDPGRPLRQGHLARRDEQAAANAGAEVVTDLSAIDALAVVPKGSGFAAKIKSQKGVKAAWLDRVNHTNAFQPDPLHDLDSFNGENAPGVLQWEDDRDGVRQAWNTTKRRRHQGRRDRLGHRPVASRAARQRAVRRQHDPVQPADRHLRRRRRPAARLLEVRHRRARDVGGEPHGRRRQRHRHQRHRARREGHGLQGARDRLRRPDELDRRRDDPRLRQRRGRHQHVARRLRRPPTIPTSRRTTPRTTSSGRTPSTTAAPRARRSSPPRATSTSATCARPSR